MKEIYKAMKEDSKKKRERNRNSGPALLEKHSIVFESKNGGAHLIVEGSKGFVDYWPGTGRWSSRTGIKGFGAKNLINAINTERSI